MDCQCRRDRGLRQGWCQRRPLRCRTDLAAGPDRRRHCQVRSSLLPDQRATVPTAVDVDRGVLAWWIPRSATGTCRHRPPLHHRFHRSRREDRFRSPPRIIQPNRMRRPPAVAKTSGQPSPLRKSTSGHHRRFSTAGDEMYPPDRCRRWFHALHALWLTAGAKPCGRCWVLWPTPPRFRRKCCEMPPAGSRRTQAAIAIDNALLQSEQQASQKQPVDRRRANQRPVAAKFLAALGRPRITAFALCGYECFKKRWKTRPTITSRMELRATGTSAKLKRNRPDTCAVRAAGSTTPAQTPRYSS